MRRECDHTADPYQVDQLVQAIQAAMERAAARETTTPSDILSALFTVLDRTLGALQHVDVSPEDRELNRIAIADALNAMLLEFGMKVH